MHKLLVAFLSLICFSACASLKSYDLVYVNDPEMHMGDDNAKNFENYIESVREGATPNTGSKSSGGCGCN